MISNAILGLGSNLNHPVEQLNTAFKSIRMHSEIQIESISSFYLTAPEGIAEQPEFVNAVCWISTTLSPDALLKFALATEHHQGRIREIKWGPRIIDIDILMFDDLLCQTPDLSLPHPELLNRSFWLIPLAEIAPQWILPNGQRVEDYARTWNTDSIRKI
ncbi:MAG: 2-amino-4-hydroxy-6-hydroxymethyldihydropteridine diphosphokinase [Gammaproteobacteria bacterium]